MKKKLNNKKGITLIALVVTIVVLLILAATSIAMLTGDDGIITNAQKAQMENQKGEVIDRMGLAYSAVRTEAMVRMSTDVGYQPIVRIAKLARIADVGNAEPIVKVARSSGYQPIAHIEELAQIAANELGIASAEKAEVPEVITDEGYHVYYQDGGATITMLYADKKFSLKAGSKAENNLYPNIKGVITLSTTEVVYSELPTSVENNDDNPDDVADLEPTAEAYFDFDETTGGIALKNSVSYYNNGGSCGLTRIVIPTTYQGKKVIKLGIYSTVNSGSGDIGFNANDIEEIVIPEGIEKSESDYVFQYASSLRILRLPNSLTSIKLGAISSTARIYVPCTRAEANAWAASRDLSYYVTRFVCTDEI